MSDEYLDDRFTDDNPDVLSKAQRQKKYREGMKARGFVCRQLWIPEDRVDEIEATVAVMRTEHHDEDLI